MVDRRFLLAMGELLSLDLLIADILAFLNEDELLFSELTSEYSLSQSTILPCFLVM